MRAFYRETICKAVSAPFLFVGFLRVAFSSKKCAWHDRFARTIVEYSGHTRRTQIALPLVLAVSAVVVGPVLFRVVLVYHDANRLSVDAEVTGTISERTPASLLEVAALKPNDQSDFGKWLNDNGRDPFEYVVEVVSNHQVTIFGETHNKQEYLLFLNRIIPALYHRAGVTCIAMEVCLAEDNQKLLQLVTSEEFDKDLMLQIARNAPWRAWGSKEYWDILETVWQLNQGLPEGKKKLRVVGLNFKWDGPSMGLVLRSGPVWEKLRIWRIVDDFLLTFKGDEVYARNVEKEIIEKGEKGIVWVGAAHSSINYVFRQKYAKMGFMLHHRYGNRVSQIRLHEPYYSEAIAALIEEAANDPVAFDVAVSPYGSLRDSSSIYFRYQPDVCFSDMAMGYIFLKSYGKLKPCEWLNGYISRDMFMKNKPFYEAMCGRKLRDSLEANQCMGKTGIHDL